MLTIAYTKRDAKKARSKMKTDTTHAAGVLSAVLYGPKEPSTPITVNAIDFKKVWGKAGESSIIVLKGPAGEEHEALIHDVDLHPVSDVPRHADFYVIEKGKKLQLAIPLEYKGVSPAVKDLGGALVKVLHTLEIEALPKDLPQTIVVDISSLATLESQILAKQLPLAEAVTLITNPEEVVAAITVVKEEVEEVTKTIDDIEVVGAKGKEVKEGEEGAADAKGAGAKDAKPAAAKGADKAPEKGAK
jgi:large subunit ribosomal protein L25